MRFKLEKMASLLLLPLSIVTPFLVSGANANAATPTDHLVHPTTGSAVTPLNSGYVKSATAATGYSDDSGTVTSSSSSTSQLDIVMSTTTLPLTVKFTITAPAGKALVAGGTYGGASGSFSYQNVRSTEACGSFKPTSWVHVDQLSLDGSGHATSFAVRFFCDGSGSSGFPPGWFWGSFADNVVPTTPHHGYYLNQGGGQLNLNTGPGAITGFGNDNYLNYLNVQSALPTAIDVHIVGMAVTPDGAGYWQVGSDGTIYPHGDAGVYGSMAGHLLNAPIVGMAATADGKGYWLVASDGGLFAFGDASYLGSMGGSHLNQPIVGIAPGSGGGYWMVASDGGIFSFGVPFLGSMGSTQLNRPVVGMAAAPGGGGYWLVASDGGVFSFGTAAFHGSTGFIQLAEPIVSLLPARDGSGYWLAASDGGVFAFQVPFYGSLGGQGTANISAIAS